MREPEHSLMLPQVLGVQGLNSDRPPGESTPPPVPSSVHQWRRNRGERLPEIVADHSSCGGNPPAERSLSADRPRVLSWVRTAP